MTGLLVQLALSWLIIWLFEKGNLSFLGFRPTRARLCDFALFFAVTAACCASGFLFRMFFAGETWVYNRALSGSAILGALWWHIKSVLFEELIFRGVLFYILIRKLGAAKAILISAAAFGIYHWFSQEVFDQLWPMITTFLITGIMGAVYAWGYARSFSLYIPCAIHLGWNLTQGFIFSQGPAGKGVFVLAEPAPVVQVSYGVYFLIFFFPLLSAWVVNGWLLWKRKEA